MLMATALAVVMMGMVSCKKDDPNNGNNNGNGTSNEGEGIYAPAMRIARTTEGSTTETWEWGTSKLASISTNNGTTSFDYNGNRISNVTTMVNGEEMQMKYSYQDGWLTNMALIQDNRNIVTTDIRHNANDQIKGFSATLNPDYLMQMIGSMLGGLMKNGNDPKLTFTNQDIQVSYEWEGKNVRRMITTANLTGKLSASDLVDIIGEENLGELGSLIGLLSGEFPLSISMKDTTDYTYDNKKNPYLMLLSEGPTPVVLSENNQLTSEESGVADLDISISFFGQTFPINQSVPISNNNSWSYTYNEQGFPTTITTDGKTKTITYAE